MFVACGGRLHLHLFRLSVMNRFQYICIVYNAKLAYLCDSSNFCLGDVAVEVRLVGAGNFDDFAKTSMF